MAHRGALPWSVTMERQSQHSFMDQGINMAMMCKNNDPSTKDEGVGTFVQLVYLTVVEQYCNKYALILLINVWG